MSRQFKTVMHRLRMDGEACVCVFNVKSGEEVQKFIQTLQSEIQKNIGKSFTINSVPCASKSVSVRLLVSLNAGK